MILEEILSISTALKNSKKEKILIFHKFLFDYDDNRKNRKNIRHFAGFDFEPETVDFENKLKDVKEKFNLNELITIANILNISFEGNKDELAKSLLTNLCNIEELAANLANSASSESESESESNKKKINSGEIENSLVQCSIIDNKNNDCSNKNSKVNCIINENSNGQSFSNVSYCDLESIITKFCAEAHENINNWIENFENVSKLFQLTELQKFIFAKRSLGGNAALFVRTEPTIINFAKLKEALINEFSIEINSACLHELLSKRKLRLNETIQEYFLKMKELACSGKIEDSAIIHYVIQGIPDRNENKIILYGCKNLSEFKEKLKIYELMKKDFVNNKCDSAFHMDKNKPKYMHNARGNFKNNDEKQIFSRYDEKYKFSNKDSKNKYDRVDGFKSKNNENRMCYNCGDRNHIAKFCVHKDKGVKCFRCENFGHRASECTRTNPKSEVASINVCSYPKLKKLTMLNNLSVNALIDCGSETTLIRKSVFDKLSVKKLFPTKLKLNGFGNCGIKPLGYFNGNIEIENFKCVAETYIVNDYVMSQDYDMIIGLNVLMQGETVINENGVTITSKSQNVEEPHSLAILPINLANDGEELNIEADIPKLFKEQIQQLVFNYAPNKTKSTDIDLKICVKNNEPIYHQPRRLPFSERKIVETQIAEWLAHGIIEISSSEYCSPVVIVKKKDGSPRVCIDYRKLNKIVVKDRFPLPLIEDILDRLQGARIYSTIDLKNGFFHVDVHKDSRKYTSFITHEGQYQFTKVPFGYCNSPAVFQRFINTVFRPLINSGIVLPYMDDVIVLASSLEEAIERLKLVFELASDYGLQINFKKSHFLKKRIEFLGHEIEEGNIFPSPLKTKAVLNFPEPTNLKQIQSFLGLAGYFRKFIPGYSLIARPLSDLLKKDKKFKFGEEEKCAFARLKTMLADRPVLAIYNPNYETELHTDASLEGYGAILMQKSPDDGNFHPTYFMSRKTSDAEKKYSSYELEVLAIIEALKKFRIYLLGISFKLVTDCSAFQKTMDKRDLSTRVARWALLLQEFHYTIEHRPGCKIPHVDALSRSPIDICCLSVENVVPKIKNAQDNDNQIKVIKELLKLSNYEDYSERNGILYKFLNGKELIVIPEAMQTEVIKDAHERGHTGINYTEKALEDYYYIPKVRQKIENVIANCVHCILVNRKQGKKEGFLHPLHKADIPLHTYHLDHLGPLESTSKKYKHILVVVDAFTKFVWIYPTKTTTTAEVIAKLEIQKSVFGSPSKLISDRGTAFTSTDFSNYCDKEGIEHHLVTTGLPRANGQVERIIRSIIPVLSKLSLKNPAEWYKFTNQLQQTINSTYQRSINTSPYELLFGTKMNVKGLDKLKKMVEDEFQDNFEAQREELRKNAKKQIFKIQEENRKTYNLRRKNPNLYKIGDLVAIKRTQFGPHLKLKSKYFGPYKITRIKGGNTYDVCKEGMHEGPNCTSTCAEYIKKWTVYDPNVT